MAHEPLTERERRVLEAVIQTYVETAEPAGSRTLSRRFGLGVSPATIRNTMSDLEDKGFLFHPHTSAGRVPTDIAYRMYVDQLMRVAPVQPEARDRLKGELTAGGSAIETVLRRAAQVLGVLTQELGVALGPSIEELVLERLELIRISAERLLLVLRLGGGGAHTIFVEAPGALPETALAAVALVLNERLGGLTLRQIRATLPERLRDTSAPEEARELLNIFIQEGEQLFDVAPALGREVMLGQTSVLVEQPEFADSGNMRQLLAITDQRHELGELLRRRGAQSGISITIGRENPDPSLSRFTVVTAEYRVGGLAGVIGVIGPTRMPYDKVVSLVTHTSRLITELLD
ncbi:MAG TPA: heat-inducible transcriptional repressor HrcA [Gemmatimonadaceae bacterium]|nr:heat-inducible transcriptional repressor HrcA [Gemmatimonadaceae bacterium]